MFISNLGRPGVASGHYPEKKVKEPGWVEKSWSRLTQSMGPQAVVPPPEAHQFVARVARLENEFKELSIPEIKTELKEVRSLLHSQGFHPYYVARSFGLICELIGRMQGVRPTDTQVLAGWGLLHHCAVESAAADDNTVTIALAASTVALAGIPVHVITATDYLVGRDAERMEPLYRALGLSMGKVMAGMNLPARQENYHAEITYTTHKQIAFDYLRDHLASEGRRGRLQRHLDRLNENPDETRKLLLRGLCFAIVDEADTVLMDDARAPLLISRNTDNPGARQVYEKALELANTLHLGVDFEIDDLTGRINLTSSGRIRIAQMTEDLGGMWSGMERSQELVAQALTAVHLFLRGHHYTVEAEKINVDERSARKLSVDPAWQRGLFQLLEMKEDLPYSGDRETLAKICYQELFPRYLHLGAISRTVCEARKELEQVYRLKVMRVRTAQRIKSRTGLFRLFPDSGKKWEALVDRVEAVHQSGRPVLIAVRSVAVAELLSSILEKRGLSHQVLVGSQDEDEADRLRTAADTGRITLLANHAGRGMTLPASPETVKKGGVHAILAEVSEARRHDRQCIQRCEAVGHAGSYDHFISLEDDVVRMFSPGWAVRGVSRMGWMGSWVGRIFLALTQRAAERHHANSRMKLQDMDKQTNRILAFSGQSE